MTCEPDTRVLQSGQQTGTILATRRCALATYIVLYRFTDEGRKNVKRSVERAEDIRKQNEARGFKVIGMYWTQGRYDLISLVVAPSEEAMVAGLFNIAEAGNVVSETLRAFTAEEMQKIVAQGW